MASFPMLVSIWQISRNACSVSARMYCTSSGSQTKCTSSRYAKTSAPGGRWARTCTNAGCNARQNNAGMSASPCSPPSPCRIGRALLY
eukprot:4146006-Pyramimonas_sp.AAC.1